MIDRIKESILHSPKSVEKKFKNNLPLLGKIYALISSVAGYLLLLFAKLVESRLKSQKRDFVALHSKSNNNYYKLLAFATHSPENSTTNSKQKIVPHFNCSCDFGGCECCVIVQVSYAIGGLSGHHSRKHSPLFFAYFKFGYFV